jgi:hypothetical protein
MPITNLNGGVYKPRQVIHNLFWILSKKDRHTFRVTVRITGTPTNKEQAMKITTFTEAQLERIEQALFAQAFRSYAVVMNPLEDADERERHEAIQNQCDDICEIVSEYLNDLDAKRQIGDDLTDAGIARFLA